MSLSIWTVVVCLTVLASAFRGFSVGFTGQVSSVLGIAIGAVSAHLFSGDIAIDLLAPLLPVGSVEAFYVIGFLSAAAVFVAVYWICVTLTRVVDKALSLIAGGIGDALAGALFGIFEGLLLLSVAMNVILCLVPDGTLLRLCASDDANAPHSVLLLAPAVLGTPDADDLYHAVQLHEARKISLAEPQEVLWHHTSPLFSV